MPGGLESRLLREQVKAQRLQNAAAAMQLAGPQQLLQEAGMMEALMGQQQTRTQSADLHPGALTGQGLKNQAAQNELNVFEEDRERDWQYKQDSLDAARSNAIAGMLSVGGEHGDVRPMIESYLNSLGIEGSIKPYPSMFQQQNAVDPEQEARDQMMRDAILNLAN
jgi:hypothetical protein